MNIHHTTNPDTFCTSFDEWLNHINFQSFLIRRRNRLREELVDKLAPLKPARK